MRRSPLVRPIRRRRSFTLIELLITMSIVALLSTTMVFVMAGALEESRVARAKGQVTKINELLMRRWEEYRTRPVRKRIPIGVTGRVAAITRLNALRELMRMEMPDRATDVLDPRQFLDADPAMWRSHQRRVVSGWGANPTHQSAECLYLILAQLRDGDGSALDSFKPEEIGDVDLDGMKEILDPWGNPIHFLRWAPRLQSPLQDYTYGAPRFAPDPFDPFRAGVANYQTDSPNWAIYPFVISAGPDGIYGYDEDIDLRYKDTTPTPNNPYDTNSTAGMPFANGGQDDIHSHLLD